MSFRCFVRRGKPRVLVGGAVALGMVVSTVGPLSLSVAASAPAVGTILLAAGTVTLNGAAQAGATVSVEQWPDSLTGDSDVVTTNIGSVQTDSSGHWELRVPQGAFPQAEDGSPDLHVTAVAGDRYAVTNKSADDPTSTDGAQKQASGQPLADAGGVDLAGPTGFALSSPMAASQFVRALRLKGAYGDGTDGMPCGQVFVRNLDWTNIYFTRIWTASQTRGRVIMSSGASHEMGVEIGATDTRGGFHAGGTRSVSTSSGYNSNFTLYNVGVGNAWSYKLYRVGCAGIPNSFHYEARPYRLESGPKYTASTMPTWCLNPNYYPAGQDFFRDINKQASLNLTGDVMGSHVTAQSGWDTKMNVTFHFYYAGDMCSGSSVDGIFNAKYLRTRR